MRCYSDIKRVMGMIKQINRYLNEGKKKKKRRYLYNVVSIFH